LQGRRNSRGCRRRGRSALVRGAVRDDFEILSSGKRGGCSRGVIDDRCRSTRRPFLFPLRGFAGRNRRRGRGTGHDPLSGCCGHFGGWWSFLLKFAACTTTTNILRPMSDFSSNTALALLSSSSPSSTDANVEYGLLPYPRVRMRCFNLCIPFDTGDLAIVTGKYYFLLQSPTVERKPELLEALLNASIPGLDADVIKFRLQVKSVIHLGESPDDMADFLLALHYGMYVIHVCSWWCLAWFSCFSGAYVVMTRPVSAESLLCFDWRQSTLNSGCATISLRDYLIPGLQL